MNNHVLTTKLKKSNVTNILKLTHYMTSILCPLPQPSPQAVVSIWTILLFILFFVIVLASRYHPK